MKTNSPLGLSTSTTRRVRRLHARAGLAALAVAAMPIGVAACDGDDGVGSGESDVTSRTTYVSIGTFLSSSDADYERWIAVRRGLERSFDQICGDTFCGGDWSNLYSLGLECSVSSKRGSVRDCLWTFAASDDVVDGATGAIASRTAFFACHADPTGNALELLDAFGDDPLYASLPGVGEPADGDLDGNDGTSFYDLLSACFESPVEVGDLAPTGEGPFVDAADRLEGETLEAWYPMLAALRQDFDDACGDTWCEGDYTNLQALRFRCSEDTTTGRLGGCTWTFAGSYEEIRSSGRLVGAHQGFACPVAVDGTAADLVAALAPTEGGASRAIDRPLPGRSTTLRDALNDCL
jgi:hypothetical protein